MTEDENQNLRTFCKQYFVHCIQYLVGEREDELLDANYVNDYEACLYISRFVADIEFKLEEADFHRNLEQERLRVMQLTTKLEKLFLHNEISSNSRVKPILSSR